MTDTSSFANTYPTVNTFPVPAPTLPSPIQNGAKPAQDDEEEPYTIKCICIFEDDDGSTVFCERCETWQHIVCYYDGQSVPDIHNCADCEPRAFDSKRATERQKRLREQNEGGDRKAKRSGSKNQRKKAKDTDQTNGWTSHERSGSNSASRDQPPPAKKQRIGHRASGSVSSVSGTPTLGIDSRKRAGSSAGAAASPTKIPIHHPPIPLYSQEFLHLYDNDQAKIDIPGNLYDTIGLASDLASWLQDPSALAQVANGRNPMEVFTYSDQPLNQPDWPVLSKQSATDNSVDFDGRHPTWRFLKVDNDVRKDDIVGEVRGKVGHFRDYCLDPNSRWQELRHPEPFVFFHPQLPIYIDSRKEGTLLRYIRRSCRPNVTLKTFITNKVEYHFCFVANQDIPRNSEITTTWYLDPQLFPTNNGLVKQEGPNDGFPDAAAISISNVLAHFGGCACDSLQPCLLANVDRRFRPRIPEVGNKQANGKRKKSKPKNTISPASTGRATNSRAGSEARKVREDDDIAEVRSASGSTRDHPRSRDMTPTSHNLPDLSGANGTELSARERRKIAAAEKKFEQLEQDQHHQHIPKKKRRSNTALGASNANTNKLPTTTISNASLPKPPRLDTMAACRSPSTSTKASPRSATPRRQLGTNSTRGSASGTPRVGSPLTRAQYVDSSIQTKPDECDLHDIPSPKPSPRNSFIPLTKRLFIRCHKDRLKEEGSERLSPVQTKHSPNSMPPPPTIPKVSKSASSPQRMQEDVEMKDADTDQTPTQPIASTPSLVPSPSFRPLPSTAAHHIAIPRNLPAKPPDNLHIQLPTSTSPDASATPTLGRTTSSLSSQSLSPLSVKAQSQAGTQTHSPGAAAPSPAKKRMSLEDYMSRRGTLATPTAEKPQSAILPNGQQQTPPVISNPVGVNAAEPSQPNIQLARATKEPPNGENGSTSDVAMKDAPALPSISTGSTGTSLPARDPRLNPAT